MKIEKGIPFPENDGRGQRAKYPWSEMEVGDSIFVATDLELLHGSVSAARGYAYRHGKKVTASAVDGGVRIWRIA